MIMKRAFDFIFSILGLILAFPLMMAAGIIILSSMGRPVFFKQQRPGLYGRPFYLYKFRTMTDERDASGRLLPDSERLTPLGIRMRELSIDELPQLFNVLKGDLSLVGPRPLMMDYLVLYNDRQKMRHSVKPGITGWAQVNGRNSISWEEKFEMDVWYAEHRDLLLDLKIILMTVKRVAKREGITGHGESTVSAFKGSEEKAG